jgi:hypothetical protein
MPGEARNPNENAPIDAIRSRDAGCRSILIAASLVITRHHTQAMSSTSSLDQHH